MLKHEFEILAGYEVSDDDYTKIIEPMYTALPDVAKEEFVKMLNRKRFALKTKRQYINEMKKIAKHLMETCEHRSDFESEQKLASLAHEYAKRFHSLDWTHDTEVYTLLLREYTYPELGRGCTYPNELVIGRGSTEYERIALV